MGTCWCVAAVWPGLAVIRLSGVCAAQQCALALRLCGFRVSIRAFPTLFTAMRLLLVEDNADLADAIIRRMRRNGHAVDWQADGMGAASVLRYQSFDLVVLDIGLPKLDGLRVLAGMRERGDSTPVLMLTARDGIEDRVQALDVGADDYLGKPFDFREFEARCRVLLRRGRGQASEVMQIGSFQFDNAAHRVSLDGEVVELPNREFRLLEILVGRLGQVVGKDEIAKGLFGFDDEAGPNAIELYIGRLRKKLAAAPVRITTVRGVGYMLEASDGGADGAG